MELSENPPRDGEVARRRRDGGGRPPTLRRPETYEARRARKEMSLPEVLLWQRLKGSPDGVSFRKQHPIAGYRADFYCAAAKLVIEVDGSAHDMGQRPARDAGRTQTLEDKGFRVVRIPARDVLRDAGAVAATVVAMASAPPPSRLRRATSPSRGGFGA